MNHFFCIPLLREVRHSHGEVAECCTLHCYVPGQAALSLTRRAKIWDWLGGPNITRPDPHIAGPRRPGRKITGWSSCLVQAIVLVSRGIWFLEKWFQPYTESLHTYWVCWKIKVVIHFYKVSLYEVQILTKLKRKVIKQSLFGSSTLVVKFHFDAQQPQNTQFHNTGVLWPLHTLTCGKIIIWKYWEQRNMQYFSTKYLNMSVFLPHNACSNCSTTSAFELAAARLIVSDRRTTFGRGRANTSSVKVRRIRFK